MKHVKNIRDLLVLGEAYSSVYIYMMRSDKWPQVQLSVNWEVNSCSTHFVPWLSCHTIQRNEGLALNSVFLMCLLLEVINIHRGTMWTGHPVHKKAWNSIKLDTCTTELLVHGKISSPANNMLGGPSDWLIRHMSWALDENVSALNNVSKRLQVSD